MIIQNRQEKAVKGMHLIIGFVENVHNMERNISQIFNKAIRVVIFIASRVCERTLWAWHLEFQCQAYQTVIADCGLFHITSIDDILVRC